MRLPWRKTAQPTGRVADQTALIMGPPMLPRYGSVIPNGILQRLTDIEQTLNTGLLPGPAINPEGVVTQFLNDAPAVSWEDPPPLKFVDPNADPGGWRAYATQLKDQPGRW